MDEKPAVLVEDLILPDLLILQVQALIYSLLPLSLCDGCHHGIRVHGEIYLG